MSAAKDKPKSKPATPEYLNNYDRIFGKKPKPAPTPPSTEKINSQPGGK